MQFEIKVTGRVQGVGYRYFVQKTATGLGITGWVKNMPDKSVMVMAQGEETEMNMFIEQLKKGPSMAHVDNLYKAAIQPTEMFDRFQIRH